MSQYPWALNALKLQRAIASAEYKTEACIREAYIKMGGLINKNMSEEIKINIELPEGSEVSVEKVETPAEVVEPIAPEENSNAEVPAVVEPEEEVTPVVEEEVDPVIEEEPAPEVAPEGEEVVANPEI